MKDRQLTIPGFAARTMPKGKRFVDMSAWKDSPLFKAALAQEKEKVQPKLFKEAKQP